MGNFSEISNDQNADRNADFKGQSQMGSAMGINTQIKLDYWPHAYNLSTFVHARRLSERINTRAVD